jgi:hypothetical protein
LWARIRDGRKMKLVDGKKTVREAGGYAHEVGKYVHEAKRSCLP